MTIDISPEAVERLAYLCQNAGLGACASTLRALLASQAETAAAVLAMREQAAAYIDARHEIHMTAKGRNPDNYISDWSMSAREIRALPTTFTDAELLAAVEQFPEVRALVDAATPFSQAVIRNGVPVAGSIGRTDVTNIRAALAPFRK